MENNLNSLAEAIYTLDKKLDLFINDTKHSFDDAIRLDDIQNKLLAEHMLRSDRLEQNNLLLEKKIEADISLLESSVTKTLEPIKFLSQLMKFFIAAGTLAASATAIILLLNKL